MARGSTGASKYKLARSSSEKVIDTTYSYLTMVAIFCMVGRSAFTTVVLLYQNNNMSKSFRAKHVFTPEEIYRREIGSKLTLVNRVVYNV